ncbi:family 78 glycoside hydrolase catalytic domain [Herbiconiux sp. KACC 21604]|uniref:alpha-L-rhamnosidase n=1 Tax=unclassified Herbiconiux TaxID=2618217 RepID=UPI001491C317|nr:alpha-L-rhamnosidase [Herbiconiux sp. SALV-R1]QJU55033.1 family 78 glycoside hydrolase catalytic domain [Herbiconiux sp. SALV-R1]WPO86173.1 family 78 glycoside hydrolase catalytic domain [Herbiconiux sp. KACC 21604]
MSWTIEADAPWSQAAARLRLDGVELRELPGADSVLVPWPFAPLEPGTHHSLELQLVGDDGSPTPWSDPLPFTTAFRTEPWRAPLLSHPAPTAEAQPVLLRTELDVAASVTRATLFATALGVYQVAVNGVDVDDHVLKPGWTAYQHRLAHETTDVTPLLRPGRNALTVRLAGGWYTEAYGFGARAARFYGDQPAVSVELRLEHTDGTVEHLASGDGWRSTVESEFVSSGLYAGETTDARRRQPGWNQPFFDDSSWHPVATRPLALEPESIDVEPVRRIEELAPVELLTTPSGAKVLDFGRIVVGRVRYIVDGPGGATVTLRHAEVLEDGELCVRALRAATSIDTHVLAGDGPEAVEPEFTFHGFRYVEVSGWPGQLEPDAFRAVVLHTELWRTGWFSCSEPLLERLHENVVQSLRGNALALPTDCPQRDERMGWTGDAQVFTPAAASLFDVDAFFGSWLADLSLEQRERGGRVPTVVPDVLGELSDVAAAGWGDAATVVPSVLFERYGDLGLLERQLPSMAAWVDHALAAAGPERLWERGFQYGDWLDPTSSRPDKAKADPGLVATAWLFRSTRLLADALAATARLATDPAARATRKADASHYARVVDEIRTAFTRSYLTPAGRLMSDAPAAYALTLAFGLVDSASVRRAMAERLAFLLRAGGYRMATGFLGTPHVLDALLDNGQAHAAEQLLLQRMCPSWLYPVTMGATTMWERWDSMLPDGSINPSGMTSFNHYALGSVADVLHRRVGGLAPAAPGYRRLRIEPWFVEALDHAAVQHDTPYGRAEVRWRRDSDDPARPTVVVAAVVPPGASAEVVLPGLTRFTVGPGRYEWRTDAPRRAARTREPLTLDDDLATLADHPGACALVSQLLARHDPDLAREFDAFARWVPGRSLRAELAAVSPPAWLTDEIDRGLRALHVDM